MSDDANPNPSPAGADPSPGAAVLSDTPYYATFKDENAKKFAEGFKTPEELAGFGAKFAGFKDLDPANLVALPKDEKDEAARAALYDRLGRPKEPGDYGISKIQNIDTQFAGQAEAMFHKLGLSAEQAKGLADFYLGYEKSATEAEHAKFKSLAEAEINQVRQEIGDAKIESGRRFAKALGITQEQLGAIESFTGAGQIIRMFAKAAEKVGEHFYQDGSGGAGEDKSYAGAMYSKEYIASLEGGSKTILP